MRLKQKGDKRVDGNEEMRRQTEQEYMRALLGACNLDEWREIIKKAVADAKAGDAKAREWLAAYVVGRPTREAPSALALLVDELVGRDRLREAIRQACTVDVMDTADLGKELDERRFEAALAKLLE